MAILGTIIVEDLADWLAIAERADVTVIDSTEIADFRKIRENQTITRIVTLAHRDISANV